jgi:hypothetical protein
LEEAKHLSQERDDVTNEWIWRMEVYRWWRYIEILIIGNFCSQTFMCTKWGWPYTGGSYIGGWL